MPNSVIVLFKRAIHIPFVKSLCTALFLVLAIIAATAQIADAIPKPASSLGNQWKNYVRETELERLNAEAAALAKVPGKIDNPQMGKVSKNRIERLVAKIKNPQDTHKSAKSNTHAQANQVGNTAADIARDQAVAAIDYTSRFMKNFTTQGGNHWNRYRDQLFIPIAILLILPGAVLTQVKAIISQGNPVVGQASPLEGIQRAIITVFLVPATYLVCNYAVDVGNSLHYTVCSEYTRLMGSDMYRDAMCAEIRAFSVRYLSENEGSLNVPDPDLSPRGDEPFAKIEGTLWGKIADPCVGIYLVPANRDDASMPQSSIAVRMAMYTANAGICAGWACLTALQMAFFYYLFFVGPIMAALYAWPMKSFQNALPNWVEGAITLAFWSFFWHVTILILALTKSQASTGLYMVTALNILATCSVKNAFDFAGVMRSAVAQAEQIGAEAAANAQSGGGGGGKGGSKGGKKGGSKKDSSTPAAAPEKVAEKPPASTPDKVAARVEPRTERDGALRSPSRVPAILTTEKTPSAPAGVRVETTLPPAARISFSPVGDSFQNTVWDDVGLAAFAVTAFTPDTPAAPDTGSFITTLNSTTGVFNDPISVGKPPSSGDVTQPARNTIASVLGNAIQEIMVYPAGIPIQDPDLIYLEKVKAEIEQQEQQEETERQSDNQLINQNQTQIQSVSENFSPDQNLYSTPEQEPDMNSNEDPRIAALKDQRFNYPPPPMVSGQPAAGFSKIPTGVALTPHQLLSKLQTVVEQTTTFAPPPPSVGSSVPSQVPFCGFSRAEGNDTNFEVQEEAIVTVADFTSDLQGQTEPEPRQANLNEALSQVLRQRGAWAQSQSQVKPPVPQSLSTSWWS